MCLYTCNRGQANTANTVTVIININTIALPTSAFYIILPCPQDPHKPFPFGATTEMKEAQYLALV